MVTQFVTPSVLTAYPGVRAKAGPTVDNVVRLINGLVAGIVGADTPNNPTIETIALEAAARPLRNPSGASSVTKGIDDYKGTFRYEGEKYERAGVFLTDGEKVELRASIVEDSVTLAPRARTLRVRVPGVRYAVRR